LLIDVNESGNKIATASATTLNKRGRSLNKTGMVVIDENEDIIDDCFFQSKK
jgi:hypothetical protein